MRDPRPVHPLFSRPCRLDGRALASLCGFFSTLGQKSIVRSEKKKIASQGPPRRYPACCLLPNAVDAKRTSMFSLPISA